ncbi:hypothetical protein Hanom_Chr02g00153541 [Helianthus anomalus]
MNRGLDVFEENGGALIIGNIVVPVMFFNVFRLQTGVNIIIITAAAHRLFRSLVSETKESFV